MGEFEQIGCQVSAFPVIAHLLFLDNTDINRSSSNSFSSKQNQHMSL